mmetsp:Transcript_79953/g.216611  ORF Transcript_79953/g.216611 Transcript_79953/m.216611 type:complete len:419 (+) Transcript_79953:109-1365(+)
MGASSASAQDKQRGSLHDSKIGVHVALLPDALPLRGHAKDLRTEKREGHLLERHLDARIVHNLSLCKKRDLEGAQLHGVDEARLVQERLRHVPHEGAHLAARAPRRRAVEEVPDACQGRPRRLWAAQRVQRSRCALDGGLLGVGRAHSVLRRLAAPQAHGALRGRDLGAAGAPQEALPPRRVLERALLAEQSLQTALLVQRGHAAEPPVVAPADVDAGAQPHRGHRGAPREAAELRPHGVALLLEIALVDLEVYAVLLSQDLLRLEAERARGEGEHHHPVGPDLPVDERPHGVRVVLARDAVGDELLEAGQWPALRDARHALRERPRLRPLSRLARPAAVGFGGHLGLHAHARLLGRVEGVDGRGHELVRQRPLLDASTRPSANARARLRTPPRRARRQRRGVWKERQARNQLAHRPQ